MSTATAMGTGPVSTLSSIQKEADRLTTQTSRTIQSAKNEFMREFFNPLIQKIAAFVENHKIGILTAGLILAGSLTLVACAMSFPFVGPIGTIAFSSLVFLTMVYSLYHLRNWALSAEVKKQ